ncbi:MAG: hypothetical protein RMN51_09655 [Verrucomicrobiota bacterium]|nr:hypothetical protein [Limisphaera sp.]MDW8382356.1 hypothetical protein [Verrucomicrobiota bacterium]
MGTTRSWLQSLVNEYNNVNNPDLPTVALTPAVDVSPVDSPLTLTISVLGYLYLTAHWGQGQTQDHTQAWYLGGSLAIFTLNAPGRNGLSGYRLWNQVPVNPPPPVPDAGATGLLLAMGVVALWTGSRRGQNRLG